MGQEVGVKRGRRIPSGEFGVGVDLCCELVSSTRFEIGRGRYFCFFGRHIDTD